MQLDESTIIEAANHWSTLHPLIVEIIEVTFPVILALLRDNFVRYLHLDFAGLTGVCNPSSLSNRHGELARRYSSTFLRGAAPCKRSMQGKAQRKLAPHHLVQIRVLRC